MKNKEQIVEAYSEYVDNYGLVISKDNAIKALDEYAKQECIEFLSWATGRNLEVSLGVFVDNEGTYNSMEDYYNLYLQSKK